MKLTKSLVKKGGKKSLKKTLKMRKSKKGGKKSLNTKKARKSVKQNKNKSLKKIKLGGAADNSRSYDTYFCNELYEQRGHTKGNTIGGYTKFQNYPEDTKDSYADDYEEFTVGESTPKLKNINESQREGGNSHYAKKNIQMGAPQEAPLGVKCLKVKRGSYLQDMIFRD